jgi:cell division protein FtsZ
MRDMGKAMMGTGEASGDRRSILAAEAAIANPLLDEVSMKGAKGLLISITGGNDLTLYEVDEAASRIRQEVDEDANIILGATFDSSLDGIIRVSVVATGIDKPAGVVDMNDQRLAEAGERLRAQAAARQAEANQSLRPAAPAPAAEAYFAQPAPQPELVQPVPAQPAEPVYAPQAYAPQAYAPPAPQAYAPNQGDVRVQRVQPQAYPEPAPAPVRRVEAPLQAAFIPPAAEQPLRAPRMPPIEEFPEPGQALMRARQYPAAPEAPAAETRRRTLLERLATFGMSRADEHAMEPQAPRLAAPQPQPQPQAPRNYPPRQPNPSPVHAEYAKRPATQRPVAPLDPHGRALPRAEDDQLEIPAFLRRQSN